MSTHELIQKIERLPPNKREAVEQYVSNLEEDISHFAPSLQKAIRESKITPGGGWAALMGAMPDMVVPDNFDDPLEFWHKQADKQKQTDNL